MKKFVLAALGLVLRAGGVAVASDYKAEYEALKEKVGTDKLETYLADWRKREPENPDAYIHSANWAFESSSVLNLSANDGKPLPAGQYNLTLDGDKIVALGPDGKPAGGIGTSPPSPSGTRQAAAYLLEALKKWPHRADIHCGVATIYAHGARWKEHLASLRTFAAAARENAGKLSWCHDEPIDSPESAFVADKLHSFALQQYRLEDQQGDERFRQIAELLMRTCPKSPKGYNDLAIYHGLSQNWKAVQPILEKAAAVEPNDALVWMNLGDNSKRLRKMDTARKCYQKVIALKPDDEMEKAAKEALKSLGKP